MGRGRYGCREVWNTATKDNSKHSYRKYWVQAHPLLPSYQQSKPVEGRQMTSMASFPHARCQCSHADRRRVLDSRAACRVRLHLDNLRSSADLTS